ncbi:hypothetical protein J6500_04765 [Bradyrhizobium sp. WSM 1704]|uniref:hypothetical protein n=1 Tax=Bradyrhizobium semiaridum TaxID=2821404 RepID=UPI001CE3591D|nr:hypothetical protein [Bradyrhizobium semiaridum]MCA6121219.1 hypothetical protein [Bradyrhizobium semiaridum]
MKDGMLLVEDTHQLSILNKEIAEEIAEAIIHMNDRETIQLFPFVEVAEDAYRFGYRAIGASEYVSTVEMPVQLVEQTVLTRASSTVGISPDGTVIARLLWSHASGSIPDQSTDLEALDALVRRAVTIENLRMEEATLSDLSTLLQRLECCISLVKEAISQMSSEPITPV